MGSEARDVDGAKTLSDELDHLWRVERPKVTRAVADAVTIPVIASGGMGSLDDLEAVVQVGGADAVAMAHVLQYGLYAIPDIRAHCVDCGIPVRRTQIQMKHNGEIQ